MYIDIHELELHAIDFRQEFRPEAIDFGPDVQQTGNLKTNGRAELVEELRGRGESVQDIRVRGDLAAEFELSCARCLEPVAHTVMRDFDLLYRPQGVDAGQEELTISGAEAEIGYYTGDGLLLEDVLREQVLLALPLKTVCREDCKGLCPQCGNNRNYESCTCGPAADPRWEALKGIKDKLQG
ncbi:MAG: DUF177 domain-containing protein [Terriglobales bacterium]